MINIPKTHLFTESDLPLVQFTHTFAQATAWLEEGMEKRWATYDLYVRDLPPSRNFLVAAGLEEILTWLKKIKFSKEDVNYLLSGKLINKKLAKYLLKFKFTGTVYAVPEGTICFPGEPMIRISAPLLEASLMESYLMNALTSNTIFLTKAARIYLANKETYAVSAGVMRSHSFESGAKAARNALICGIPSMATPAISKKYNIARPTYIVNAQHLFITSFVDELTAFRTLAKYFPDTCSFMIDTYGLENGVANAITIAKELRKKGHELVSVTVDSGDLAEGTRFVRKRLDKAGFKNVKIIIAGNLDEYKLKKLVEKKVPCDIVVIATEYITVADAPKLETIYKLSELRDKESVVYAAKFAPGKHHYPGVKQVYRKFKNKIMTEDIIGLENEKLGTPLLIKVMDKGKTCYDLPNIEQIKAYFIKQTKQLPNNLKNIDKLAEYKVAHSQKLEKLFNKVREERTK